jgi:hypothetical protein
MTEGLHIQSNRLTIENSELVHHFRLYFLGGVHIGARALHVINLIWFGYIARLSQRGGGGYFASSDDFFYLSSGCLERGVENVSTLSVLSMEGKENAHPFNMFLN